MTSVQKFLRQRHAPNTFLPVPTNATTSIYSFIAASGNYVGNYPPGYMVDTPDAALPVGYASMLLRDMGKTIKAPIDALTNAPGFFREVQFVSPVSVASATASSNFGIVGNAAATYTAGNSGDDGYGTFYIPIVIDGTIAAGAVLPTPYPCIGGQM